MANEATMIEKFTKVKRYTVADGTSISKGCILKLSGNNTAIASSGTGDPFAGVTIEEKKASDGVTEIGAAIDGVYSMTINTSATISAGNMVALSGANLIRLATAGDIIAGAVIGKALATGAVSTAIPVRIGFT